MKTYLLEELIEGMNSMRVEIGLLTVLILGTMTHPGASQERPSESRLRVLEAHQSAEGTEADSSNVMEALRVGQSPDSCETSFGQRFAFGLLGTGLGAAIGAGTGEVALALPLMVLAGASGTSIAEKACGFGGFDGALGGAAVGSLPLAIAFAANGGESEGLAPFGLMVLVTIPIGAALGGGP